MDVMLRKHITFTMDNHYQEMYNKSNISVTEILTRN